MGRWADLLRFGHSKQRPAAPEVQEFVKRVSDVLLALQAPCRTRLRLPVAVFEAGQVPDDVYAHTTPSGQVVVQPWLEQAIVEFVRDPDRVLRSPESAQTMRIVFHTVTHEAGHLTSEDEADAPADEVSLWEEGLTEIWAREHTSEVVIVSCGPAHAEAINNQPSMIGYSAHVAGIQRLFQDLSTNFGVNQAALIDRAAAVSQDRKCDVLAATIFEQATPDRFDPGERQAVTKLLATQFQRFDDLRDLSTLEARDPARARRLAMNQAVVISDEIGFLCDQLHNASTASGRDAQRSLSGIAPAQPGSHSRLRNVGDGRGGGEAGAARFRADRHMLER